MNIVNKIHGYTGIIHFFRVGKVFLFYLEALVIDFLMALSG